VRSAGASGDCFDKRIFGRRVSRARDPGGFRPLKVDRYAEIPAYSDPISTSPAITASAFQEASALVLSTRGPARVEIFSPVNTSPDIRNYAEQLRQAIRIAMRLVGGAETIAFAGNGRCASY
jgi:hypothetical protein